MGGQRRGRDADRMVLRAREQRAKLLFFVRKVEAVSRLRLAEGRPVLEHEVEAPTHVPPERLLGGGARRRDGRENAAPFAAIWAYVSPFRRRLNSSSRNPSHGRCVCASTKPGTAVLPRPSRTVSPGRGASPYRRTNSGSVPANATRPFSTRSAASLMRRSAPWAAPARAETPSGVASSARCRTDSRFRPSLPRASSADGWRSSFRARPLPCRSSTPAGRGRSCSGASAGSCASPCAARGSSFPSRPSA